MTPDAAHRRPPGHPRVTASTLVAACALAVLAIVAAVLAPAAAFAGDTTSGGTPPGQAWVRVGHFVPGMGSASIELQPIDGSAAPMMLSRSVGYGQVSDYRKLAPGDYTVLVRQSDASADSAPMLSRSFQVEADQARTVAVLGTAAAPRLAVLTDDLTPPPAGTARVRLLSATDQTGAVTVKAVDGPTIAADAVQGQVTAYATVPSGSWTLQLTGSTGSTGSTSSSGASGDATLQDVPIASGSIYTVVVLDAAGSAPKLDVVTDAAGATTSPRGGAHTGLGGAAPLQADGAARAPVGATTPVRRLALVGLLGLALLGSVAAAAAAGGPGRRRTWRLHR